MKLITLLMLCGFLFFANMIYADSADLYVFKNPANQTRFLEFTSKLRCLVCQNQSLAESNAPLAADLRNQITTMMNADESNADIIDYLVARYGDYILYEPPVVKNTLILWFAPLALIILGFMILFSVIAILQRRNKKPLLINEIDKQQINQYLGKQ